MKNISELYVIDHIKELCNQRQWSYYKLAKESNIAYSSLNAMIKHYHIPTIRNLIKICNAFDISLSQFFNTPAKSDNNETSLLLSLWYALDRQSKQLVITYMYGLSHKEIPINKEV